MRGRDRTVLTILRQSARPLWAGDVCEQIGIPWPQQMELVRPSLNRLVTLGFVRKWRDGLRVYYRAVEYTE